MRWPGPARLAGGVLYLAQGVGTAFGSGWGPLMVPLALQEIALAIWLIVKGFAEDVVADAGGEPNAPVSLQVTGERST